MTARRTSTRKAAVTEIAVDDDPIIVADDIVTEEPTPKGRKYMSHEGCDHARKGEAGKAARQVCRRNHRAWFAAEAEYLASQESDAIAV